MGATTGTIVGTGAGEELTGIGAGGELTGTAAGGDAMRGLVTGAGVTTVGGDVAGNNARVTTLGDVVGDNARVITLGDVAT